MHINIQLRHLVIGSCIVLVLPLAFENVPTQAEGGPFSPITIPKETVQETMEVEQELLGNREQILRGHLKRVNEEMRNVSREERAVVRAIEKVSAKGERASRAKLERRLSELGREKKEIAQARRELTLLLKDEQRSEKLLLASYREMQPKRSPLARRRSTEEFSEERQYILAWPVDPERGITAGFHDTEYEKRFRIAHEAIDIPVVQGTEIRAPADGIVLAVHDRGYGYSTVILQHADDLETLYGHVSKILVSEGQKVKQGDVIALSGGRPGSRGAGLLTTGPHLHFEVHAYGQPIDPLYVLSLVESYVRQDAPTF